MLDRRQLIKSAGLAVLGLQAPWLRPPARADGRPTLHGTAPVRLRRVRIEVSQLEATRDFYRDRLGLAVENLGVDRVRIRTPGSTLELHRAARNDSPFYHFAFNISRNKFRQAKAWLAQRTPLVRGADGQDHFRFLSRDADAVYFQDPAGNLVELIAHRRLCNERPGPFSPLDIHDLCEIGVVSSDVPKTVEWMSSELGATPYRQRSSSIAAVGDERGFLVVVQEGRPWFPRRQRAAVPAPLDIWLDGADADRATSLQPAASLATLHV